MTFEKSPKPSGGPATSNRRGAPRYGLIATAEVTDSASGMKLSGRISELSRKGCYLDTLNPLPTGTLVNVRITRDQGTLLAKGKIVYTQDGMGMGVTFLDLQKDQLEIIDSWLAEFPPAGA